MADFTPSPGVRGRLAPTPSGFLHLGNAVNFVLTWLLVRRAHGQLHLRIDDLDRPRLRPAYLENIFETIRWLGLDYDTGPGGPTDFEQQYSQLRHLNEYEAFLQQLRQKPGLLYACTCSRTQLLARAAHTTADCCNQEQAWADPQAAWRARLPPNLVVQFPDLWHGPVSVTLPEVMGDFVVRKKDSSPAYQIGSILDDLRLGTTLIVRGHDLLPSTAAQLFLAGQTPETAAYARTQFIHHPLLTTPAGQKLSKSQQQAGDRGIIDEADSPRVVYEAVARLLRLPATQVFTLTDLQLLFEDSGRLITVGM
ncbi:hypothetical protein LJY25_14295 [Hymenobacter sp. BT175]|uniref:glutamate--tRNA ligase family protein n=1 Tax=Hymenobacter translucens TaxID=2886507 RepID=UPI001D0DC8DC|nr:glutamate--tRNA ligase family protein [Hymenobacter translucens]MCC2547622.1 hypothetical protein [Hymenobacter translucens]